MMWFELWTPLSTRIQKAVDCLKPVEQEEKESGRALVSRPHVNYITSKKWRVLNNKWYWTNLIFFLLKWDMFRVDMRRGRRFTWWGPEPVKALQQCSLHFFCCQSLHNSESPEAKQSEKTINQSELPKNPTLIILLTTFTFTVMYYTAVGNTFITIEVFLKLL